MIRKRIITWAIISIAALSIGYFFWLRPIQLHDRAIELAKRSKMHIDDNYTFQDIANKYAETYPNQSFEWDAYPDPNNNDESHTVYLVSFSSNNKVAIQVQVDLDQGTVKEKQQLKGTKTIAF